VLTSEYEIKGKGEGKKRRPGKYSAAQDWGHLSELLPGEEQERPLARSLVLQEEQLLRLPRRVSSCRYAANL